MTLYVTNSPEETARLGGALGAQLVVGDTVFLIGELGSGKSVLARGIARALGVNGPMASPTFTLLQPYEGRIKVYHFDLYRLSDIDEFYAAGLFEYVGGDGVALVEWPLDELSVLPRIEARFERGASDDERRIELAFFGMEGRESGIAYALSEWGRKT